MISSPIENILRKLEVKWKHFEREVDVLGVDVGREEEKKGKNKV